MATNLRLKRQFRDPKSQYVLPDDVLRALDRIEREDVRALREGLLESGLAERDELDVAERELKRFFVMLLLAQRHIVAGERIGPTRRIDKLWHVFILDTRGYAAFCDAALGDFVHHVPGERADDGAEMRRLLSWYFDDVDTRRSWRGPLEWCWPE